MLFSPLLSSPHTSKGLKAPWMCGLGFGSGSSHPSSTRRVDPSERAEGPFRSAQPWAWNETAKGCFQFQAQARACSTAKGRRPLAVERAEMREGRRPSPHSQHSKVTA